MHLVIVDSFPGLMNRSVLTHATQQICRKYKRVSRVILALRFLHPDNSEVFLGSIARYR